MDSLQMPAALIARLEAALRARVFSGAQLELGTRAGALARCALGQTAWPEHLGDAAAITEHTPFDVASLTKALVTSLVAMRAVEGGALDLDAPLGALLAPALGARGAPALLASITPRQLLTHRAGLAAWRPFYERVASEARTRPAGRDRVRALALAEPLEAAPGARERYSDLGYILLDWALEAALGAPLDALFEAHVAGPLGLSRSRFVAQLDGAAPLAAAACTEVVPWRGGVIRGTVHDHNAWAMGGRAGHAGLFSTAADVGRIARRLLAVDAGEGDGWLRPATLGRFWSRDDMLPGGHFALGWDTPSGGLSSAGARVSRERSVGHLGFTGCSLWIDRRRAAYVVLLTNRVHPVGPHDDPRIRGLRPAIHDLAWDALDAGR